MRPTASTTCTQKLSHWVPRSRSTGCARLSASLAWNTDGSKLLMPEFVAKRGHHSPLAKLSVPATLWLCSAQMQLLCGTFKQMEALPLTMWPSRLPSLSDGLSPTADA